MSDSAKYFGTQKRGEIFELKEELLVSDIAKKRDAVKKVIAAMTVGKDVSSLFTDVLNCMMTSNVEIKKLVYLYIMNYASSNPDLCILAVNAFVKDAGDMANPMLRALSVRTMGCIRVEKITEYLCEPLRKCLKDEDPYVRKTAAVCVAKLYDISPDLVEVQGFLDDLRKMLGDSNPMVVANSVAALSEIAESGKADAFEVTHTILQKLLAALNECTEWGQVFILDALAFYTPSDEREAESIIDRVSPRLQHANSAVVLSSTKVILHNLDSISNNDTIKAVTKKLAPPLVTLLSSESEIQYVALRNINLIVQKRPSILSHEVKVFFCKYNDPIYVKMEKLEIMVMLASERNVEQVLLEFKEYATEVDVEFVRRSVRAIGRCAIKLEGAAERCINVLLDLITTKVNYVVQEAIVVIKDIFRKYPNRYEAIIGTLCENLDTLDEPEAKASMIWIIGEYAERIDNAGELMEQFLETFADESVSVQLQLLTATVKLFLKQPNGTQEMVQRVLQLATQGSDNPDLRDRGFVYWRLLSTDPEAAKAVVLAEKPTIHDDSGQLAPDILDQLLKHLSTLASVYHRLPETFVSRVKVANQRDDDDDEEDGSSHHAAPATHSQAAPKASGGAAAAPPPKQVDLMSDLFGDSPAPAPAASATVHHAPAPAASLLDDLMGGFGAPAPAPAPQAFNLPVICTAQQGKGMEIKGHLVRRNGETVYDFVISNQTQQPLSGFAIQFNKNLFSVMPGTIPAITVNPGQSVPTSFSVKFGDASQAVIQHAQAAGPQPSQLQIALKNNVGVNYFSDNVLLHSVFTESVSVEQGPFLQEWKSLESVETVLVLKGVSGDHVDEKTQRLRAANVFQVARRRNDQGYEEVYTTSRCGNGAHVLCMLVFAPGKGCKCSARSSVAGLAALMMPALEAILA